MNQSFVIQQYNIGNDQLAICEPAVQIVNDHYQQHKEAAYWARVWPAAIGLCRFLQEHPHYIIDKKLLELAAGLGLPGLFAARWARQVIITDKDPAAAFYVEQSARHLNYQHVEARTINWKEVASLPLPELVLLSDVNYEPGVFDELHQVVHYFMQHQVPILLSTPERLMAKPFINGLLPHCSLQWQTEVSLNAIETAVSVFVVGGAFR